MAKVSIPTDVGCGMVNSLKWGSEQDRAFIEIKERLCGAPLLALPDFSKTLRLSVMPQE